MIYARAQERITCETGHIICTLARTVRVGDQMDPSRDLKHWQQPEPMPGQMSGTVRCRVCDGLWWSNGLFHFDDGWRHGKAAGASR